MNKNPVKYIPADYIMKAFPEIRSLELLTTIFYILNGYNNEDLMKVFNISEGGVKYRKTEILRKTKCKNSTDIISQYLSVENKLIAHMWPRKSYLTDQSKVEVK